MRAYTIHTGVGPTDRESAQHFWTRGETLTNVLCAPDGVRTPATENLESDALPTEPPRHRIADGSSVDMASVCPSVTYQ